MKPTADIISLASARGQRLESENDMVNAVGNKTAVMVVEDSASLSLIYTGYLEQAGYSSTACETGEQALKALRAAPPSVLVLDLGLPDMTGQEIIEKIREEAIPTAVIVITSNASLKVAVDAMRLGAFDYLVKPFSDERLITTVRNALEQVSLQQEVKSFRAMAKKPQGMNGFIGSSPQMQAVYRTIESAAASRTTVFITGESGTGKEVCANAIHVSSERGKRSFVVINCAAIPHDLMESEIFGHVKGAFTGATQDRTGAASEANGGTLFLDEICEMDLDLQAKLLRLLQTGTYQRVGSNKTEKSDLRVVCATNRDPRAEVTAGRFREDLFYRLHVIPIELPALRSRGKDIIEIAETLLTRFTEEEGKSFSAFSEDAIAAIRSHDWPGNVRELENAIRNAIVLHDGEALSAAMLPAWVNGSAARQMTAASRAMHQAAHPAAPGKAESYSRQIRPLWQIEREAILHALEVCNGSVPRAAAFLEVGVSTIYRKKAEWDAEGQERIAAS
jgi:DNA-binding NtrC family response regulator